MPIIRKKMRAMKKQYGKKKGKQVYHAAENKQKRRASRSRFVAGRAARRALNI